MPWGGQEALAIRRQALGEKHPSTATSLNNLGSLIQAMGDLPAARPEDVALEAEQVLGLDADEMWHLAQQEKVSFRLGAGFLSSMPHDKRLVDLWPRLTTADQDRVITIVEGLVYAKEAEALAPKPKKAVKSK